MIKRCDRIGTVSLCERDHGGVHDPERKVEILLGEVGDPLPLRLEHRLDDDFPVGDRTAKRQFGMGTDPVCQ